MRDLRGHGLLKHKEIGESTEREQKTYISNFGSFLGAPPIRFFWIYRIRSQSKD